MSVSPGVQAKAERLLRDSRVVISCDDVDGITARVTGDHDLYQPRLTPSGWSCPCPAQGVCAHVLAVEVVTGWTR